MGSSESNMCMRLGETCNNTRSHSYITRIANEPDENVWHILVSFVHGRRFACFGVRRVLWQTCAKGKTR